MAEHLQFRLKTIASPGNVEKVFATKVGGVSATLTHYLEKAKVAVHEESGMVECELAANALGPNGVEIGNTAAQKFLLSTADVSQVFEY